MHNISPVYARFVVRELLSRATSEAALFSKTSLTREELETGGDISIDDFVTILENARVVSGDEKLGLMIGRQSTLVALGPMGIAAATGENVRAGLQLMEKFSRLHASYSAVELTSSLRGISIRIHFLESLGSVARFHAETSVMLLQDYVETLTGLSLNDAEYRMGFPEPAYSDEYTQLLHSPMSFDWEQTSIELPAHWLDLRSPYYNKEIWNQTQQQLSRQMKLLSNKEQNCYSQHLRALLKSYQPPLPDLAAAAANLHLSERTLNRRLKQEATSYREIKNELLRVWAQDYLRETNDSVEAISAALGYQDAANFRRAFRKWEACSPQAFREREREIPDNTLGSTSP